MAATVIVNVSGGLLLLIAGIVIAVLYPKIRGWHRELWFWPAIERWRANRRRRSTG